MRICKLFSFEAAHVLPAHPGKCRFMHGHSYRLEVTVAGALHESGPQRGMVADFDIVAEIVKREVLAVLDHTSLNEHLENPTAECIALWIWQRIAPHISDLDQIVLWETATACAILRRDDLPITR